MYRAVICLDGQTTGRIPYSIRGMFELGHRLGWVEEVREVKEREVDLFVKTFCVGDFNVFLVRELLYTFII